MGDLRVAVLASGRGSNLQALLDAAATGAIAARVELVVSDRPGAPCLERAQEADVPSLVVAPSGTRDGDDARLVEALREARPDVVVLAGFMRIVGARVLDAFCDRIVNVHPSLLPAFRGARAVRDALRAGVRVTGCTTHLVTAELDAGPILLQAACAVEPGDTEASLHARVQAMEHVLLPRTVQLFAEDRVRVEGDRARILPGPPWSPPPLPGVLWSA